MADPASDISRRINAERVLIIAWLRAILLQLAHPLIAAGVAEHSTFRGGTSAALCRLHQTIGAMLAISFGTADQRQAAIDGIRAIHRRVHGQLPNACGPFAAGTNYSAEDPDLLLWVHATLIESVLLAYEQLVAPLAPADRDRYCAESADVAVALGADVDAVPQTWNAMRAVLARGYPSGDIVVGDQARALAASLVTPFGGWIGRRLLTPILSVVAAGQLPAPIRTQYGFAWSRGRERIFLGMIALFRAMRRILPRQFAWWRAARSRNLLASCRGLHSGRPDDTTAENAELAAEHFALKKQLSELVLERQRLHRTGGTREQHEEHRRKLHEKVLELEQHAEGLRNARKPPR